MEKEWEKDGNDGREKGVRMERRKKDVKWRKENNGGRMEG